MKMRRQCGKVINDAFRQHLLVSVSAGQNDIQKLCKRNTLGFLRGRGTIS